MPDRAYPWVAITGGLIALLFLGLLTASAALLWLQLRKIHQLDAQLDVASKDARLWRAAFQEIREEIHAAEGEAVPNVWAQLADLDQLDQQIAPLYLGGQP